MPAQYREITRKDWLETIAYLLIWIAVVSLSAFFLLPAYWYIWIILVGGGLFWLVQWHAQNFAYRCPHCGQEFEISTWIDFISPHGPDFKGGGWKYLKCPKCHVRSRAAELRIKK